MIDRQPAKSKHRDVVARGLLLIGLTIGISTVWAQYPPGPRITKNGTAVLLQDYASLPLSSKTTGTYPPPISFTDQLGRVNFLRSEPANASQSSSRFFVSDLNRKSVPPGQEHQTVHGLYQLRRGLSEIRQHSRIQRRPRHDCIRSGLRR